TSIDAALHASKEVPLERILNVANLLTHFAASDDGQAVIIANKRIANILKKAGNINMEVNEELLVENAEKTLYAALTALVNFGFPVLPAAQLQELATLREPVDTFFDDVMVMADDAAVKGNRLALLGQLRALFLQLADVSKL
ncbi:MAG: DALR anticodon-binding domain-containing protein, partial [Mariprofundaceae bacterium]|nr:DALR anticodon-binding domain-containing protein [Mariprofundaceae bacterium]